MVILVTYIRVIFDVPLASKMQVNLELEDISNIYIRNIRPCKFQGPFGAIHCTCFKLACNSKMTD